MDTKRSAKGCNDVELLDILAHNEAGGGLQQQIALDIG